MVKYEIKSVGKDDDMVMLVRTEEQNHGPGLPPVSSKSIILYNDELDYLMETLKHYADKNRN
jgi:hypothetical protein